jgi:hypothetical protein
MVPHAACGRSQIRSSKPDIAAAAGDTATALQAVEEMAERFDVPGPKLTAETLLAAAGNASTTSQHKAVADAVARAEEYKLALDLCESARSSAQKARQYSLTKELAAKIEDIHNLVSAGRTAAGRRSGRDQDHAAVGGDREVGTGDSDGDERAR